MKAAANPAAMRRRWDRMAALAGAGLLLALPPASLGIVSFAAMAVVLGLGCGVLALPPGRPAALPALALGVLGLVLAWSYGAYYLMVGVVSLAQAMPGALAGSLAALPFVGLFGLAQRWLRPASQAAT